MIQCIFMYFNNTALLVLNSCNYNNYWRHWYYHYIILLPSCSRDRCVVQTNLVYSNDDQERVDRNFMTPGVGVLVLGWGHISHIVNIHYFFRNLHLYSRAWFRKSKCILMMMKEGSTKIVNFMTHGAGVLVLGRCQVVKMQKFFSSSCLH